MTAVAGAPAPRLSRVPVLMGALILGLVVVAVVSAGLGQLPIPPAQILGSVAQHVNDVLGARVLPVLETPAHVNGDATLWAIRFPRIAMAAVVGAALAVGGAVMQGVFRNPLAEPGVVGVSSGAALGAAAVIVTGLDALGPLTAPAVAFVGGLIATLLVYLTARARGRTEVVTLVLTGIAVNAVGGAGIALLTFLGTTQQREQIVFWQLGSLNGTRWQDVAIVLPITAAGIVAAALLSRRLDLLALGERQAQHLGVPIERTRIAAIVVVAALTSAAVALCGIIAFVGLVVPHLLRMVLGPAHWALIGTSAVGGALLLVSADAVARTAVPYADLPIGMLTALVGGPFFFWLLRRARVRSGGWA
ncbi:MULTISPECIES: iron ABC transporter permease [unclassified Rathayibacter]|uniref:FecCD family ABC transporter permease n=1 Tax=unclassified Rathayibacter TaxID=2609250 RepID=UPI000CE8DA2E|nr:MULTISPECIES: iron ABC transporter permease [unclassified Rathayibacter]PPG07118.1 heme ABC transporter permease [Rathayibacter sp. AY2B1]PPG69385.1 heme ABC transporter permease [Rathayibacter sp. AY1F4]